MGTRITDTPELGLELFEFVNPGWDHGEMGECGRDPAGEGLQVTGRYVGEGLYVRGT